MSIRRRAVVAGLLGAPLLAAKARADELRLSEFAPQLPPPDAEIPLGPSLYPDDGLPRWQHFAVRIAAGDARPAITVVIDDMGVMHPGTPRAVALPGPLTLSWFPFASNLAQQVQAGRERGHEATLHMPMQAFSDSIAWTGPDPLRIDLAPEENLRRLINAMDAVPNTVGLNNHMGSVATRSTPLMQLVAEETRRRGMLFLDSLTIDHSVAYHEAAAADVPATSRDVFIDDSNERGAIARQLELTEQIALRHGHAIAIGHPREHTLDALEYWLPRLHEKGFALWPLSATVALRNNIVMPTA